MGSGILSEAMGHEGLPRNQIKFQFTILMSNNSCIVEAYGSLHIKPYQYWSMSYVDLSLPLAVERLAKVH